MLQHGHPALPAPPRLPAATSADICCHSAPGKHHMLARLGHGPPPSHSLPSTATGPAQHLHPSRSSPIPWGAWASPHVSGPPGDDVYAYCLSQAFTHSTPHGPGSPGLPPETEIGNYAFKCLQLTQMAHEKKKKSVHTHAYTHTHGAGGRAEAGRGREKTQRATKGAGI